MALTVLLVAGLWWVWQEALPALSAIGDLVTMDYVGGQTRIGYAGQSKGTIDGEPFNAALMRIWMADTPVQADLKKAMLGGA